MESIANDVYSREVSNWREHCVRTVQESNFTLVVRSLRLCDEHVETSLVSREFLSEFLASHVLCLLYHPEVEDLSLNNEVVLVANLVLYLYDVLTWESWYDTVNECCAYVVVFLEPLRESLSLLTEVWSP